MPSQILVILVIVIYKYTIIGRLINIRKIAYFLYFLVQQLEPWRVSLRIPILMLSIAERITARTSKIGRPCCTTPMLAIYCYRLQVQSVQTIQHVTIVEEYVFIILTIHCTQLLCC